MKNHIKEIILEYVSQNKNELYYHGTSNLGHDNFNKNHINYFTKNYNFDCIIPHDAHSVVSYPTIGKDKVEIVDRIVI